MSFVPTATSSSSPGERHEVVRGRELPRDGRRSSAPTSRSSWDRWRDREPAATDILWLARTDKESRFGAEHPGESRGPSWWTGSSRSRTSRGGRRRRRRPALENVHEITARFEEGGSAGPGADAALLSAYDTLAAQRVERGCRILARGRVVVADRLHGHILSLLMGLPNVVLDNSYGKTRAVYETWTARCELATWADSPDEALAAARRICLPSTAEPVPEPLVESPPASCRRGSGAARTGSSRC